MSETVKWNRELTPGELRKLVDAFFEVTDEKKWNSARLFNYIGWSKDKWYRSKEKPEYRGVIDHASQMIEQKYLDDLNKPACTGAIFALKNFAGYADQKDIKATVSGGLTLESMLRGKKVKA